MATRRVLIGGMKEETNTFVPYLASLDDFRNGVYFAEGDDLLPAFTGRGLEISGFLDALRAGGGKPVLTVAAEAVMSGPVEHSALHWFIERWLDALDRAAPVDGVLLSLHGATSTDRSEDACGDILAAIRERAGPGVFIGATLDLHANVTQKMMQAANVLYGFHTYPHVDQYQVGLRVGQWALAALNGEIRPVMALCKLPMILPAGEQSTLRGPLAELVLRADEVERQPGILGASVFAVQPWLDLHETGCAVVVVGDGDRHLAQQKAAELGQHFWAGRHAYLVNEPSAQEAVRQAMQVDGGPVVLADLGDGPGGGAGGDSTVLLRAFLEVPAAQRGTALLTVTDPEAVAIAAAAGVGHRVSVTVGGKIATGFFPPVPVTGRVEYVGEPVYSPYKTVTSMGPVAVLDVDGVHILLTHKRIYTYAAEPYEAVGLDPQHAKIVVAKSSAQFREYFEAVARKIILVNTPGPTSQDLLSLPFRRLIHPIFPWEDWEWSPYIEE